MKSTTRFSNNKKGLECLNCGQPLHGNENFCPECGQVNDDIPLSITQFISEFFAGFFSFDSRFFKTLLPLLFKPGKVSKDYIQGKRMKYTNPFQMYLHTSIIFFLLIGLMSTISNYKNLDTEKLDSEQEKDSIINVLQEEGVKISKENFAVKYSEILDSIFQNSDYKKQLNDEKIKKETKDSLYNNLIKIGADVKLNINNNINLKNGFLKINFNTIEQKDTEEVTEELNTYLEEHNIQLPHESSEEKDIIYLNEKLVERSTDFRKFIDFSEKNEDISPTKALDSLGIGKTRFNLFKYQKAQEINKIKEDKDYRKAYLKSSISKISIAIFFLLPILTLFFSLLYIRHPYSYSEHLVVVFNIQTVFFLFLIITTLLDALLKTNALSGIALLVVFPFYIYKTLRNFYEQRRFKTIIKFILLSFTSFILALVGVTIVFFLAFIF